MGVEVRIGGGAANATQGAVTGSIGSTPTSVGSDASGTAPATEAAPASLTRPDDSPVPQSATVNGGAAGPAPIRAKRALYNCAKCPGYCCSYPIIDVTHRDIARLARHFGLPYEVAELRFTRGNGGKKRVMRRKDDTIFGRVCRFFDTEKRRCTVYEARPHVCRTYPTGRCGYYDFLSFERRLQDDPEFIASTNNR